MNIVRAIGYTTIVLICGYIVGLPIGYLYGPIVSPPSGSPRIDQFQVNSMTFFGTSGSATNAINMSIHNTGSASWTIQSTAQVNTPTIYTVAAMSPTYNHNNNKLNCTNGNTIGISINGVGWTSGKQYNVTLLLTDGIEITYQCSAP